MTPEGSYVYIKNAALDLDPRGVVCKDAHIMVATQLFFQDP